MGVHRRSLGARAIVFALALAACATPEPVTEWRDPPPDILLAGPAMSFKVAGRRPIQEVPLPPEWPQFSIPQAERLVLYRVADSLERTAFRVRERRLVGTFAAGETYLLHFPAGPVLRDKYDLLCRVKGIHRDLLKRGVGITDRVCTQIMCPPDVFTADRLLDQFVELGDFPGMFDRSELTGLQLGPISLPRGSRNLCDQCLGRDWGIVTIPDCRISRPTPSCWKANGPGPTTQGQVENITNRLVVGAINAVVAHPANADIVYVGSVNGGIWQTTNARSANPRWRQQTDRADSLSIGALAFDPTDSANLTLVAGTGRFSSNSRLGGARVGLLRTTNGSTWSTIDGGGTLRGLNISGVAPRGSTIVLSANAADVPANRGVWRSIDAGVTWTRQSGAAGTGLPVGAAFDLASDPATGTRLFTNAGGNGVYLSTDTGATWNRVSNAAMNTLIATSVNVKITVGSANNVFVAIVGAAGRLSGIFRSGDGGTNWTALDLPLTTENAGAQFGIHPGSQGDTHVSFAADLTDANVVYVGGDRQPCFTESAGCAHPVTPRWPNSVGARDFSGRLFRIDASLAAGTQAVPLTHQNTASRSAPHADSRDMAIDLNGDLIEVDDGGVYRRTVPRQNTGDWLSMNGDIQTTEFHSVAWDSVGKIVIGGAQDTGTPQQPSRATVTWQSVSTADGGVVGVDDIGTPGRSVRYSSFQFLSGFRRRVFDATNTLQSEAFPNLTEVAPSNPLVAQFYTPVRLNNMDPSRMIIGGGNSVYESLDQGDTVTEIGAGIVVNANGSSKPIAYGASGNPDMLYIGSGAQIFVRNAAAPTALNASATYPGTAAIVDIAIEVSHPNTAYVADNANVFMTTDGGATWTNVTGNLGTLNAGAIRSLARSRLGLAVGTDVGVFSAPAPAFNVWSELACGLPRVPVYELNYDRTDGVFVAGTLGRGAWVIVE